jgi:hypothetical protein
MFKLVGAGFIFALVFSLGAEAKLCKWVDDKGDTHYGDVIPSQYASKNVDQSGKAEVGDECSSRKSPDGSNAKDDEARKKIAAKKELEENKRRANALRNTYSSEKEIDLALERNSALVNARIDAQTVQLKSAQDALGELNKYVDSRSRDGKAIQPSVYDEISQAEARVSKLQLERAKSEEELKLMKARFEEDKILYRKISVLPPPNDAEIKLNVSCPCPARGNAGAYPDYPVKSRRARKTKSWDQY